MCLIPTSARHSVITPKASFFEVFGRGIFLCAQGRGFILALIAFQSYTLFVMHNTAPICRSGSLLIAERFWRSHL